MLDDPSFVAAQYSQIDPLQARIALHKRFSTNPIPWTQWLFNQLPLGQTGCLLEVGCGPGDLWKENLHRLPVGWWFNLSDLQSAMVERARSRLQSQARFRFLRLDAQFLPFAAGEFDLVVANHMLYHVADLEGTLAQLVRVLKPDGWLVAATNGASHMLELFQLMSSTLPESWFARNDITTSGVGMSFNLDTGGSLAGRFLKNVEVRRHSNDLRVTEAEPLLAYILSLFPGREEITERGIRPLIEFLDDHFSHSDFLRITKDVGIILGRKD